jgi:hypothetical protein
MIQPGDRVEYSTTLIRKLGSERGRLWAIVGTVQQVEGHFVKVFWDDGRYSTIAIENLQAVCDKQSEPLKPSSSEFFHYGRTLFGVGVPK